MVPGPGWLIGTNNLILVVTKTVQLNLIEVAHMIRESRWASEEKRRMPVENGLMTQPRRGRAITVRTPGRAPFIEAASNPLLDDVAAEPAEDDLLELEGADEEEENEETPPQHDDSEELEM